MTKRLTFISDTHSKHKQITEDLPGGDILLCAGDISSMGYKHEIKEFCAWFDKIKNYNHKIFIAGNHDWLFQKNPELAKEIVAGYKTITYLQDETITIDGINIYGSPWQPEFYNWAFNLPRNGEEITKKWAEIPENTDILITHGPAWGYLDNINGRMDKLGCELLTERILTINPKIHLCGHIHTGNGYRFNGKTHFVNAAVLDERYIYMQNPMTMDWEVETNCNNWI